jgi:DNA repair protein RecO (recombination protein O)
MQRIREFGWAVLYQEVLSSVIKNCVALYMMELLQKSLKQPEENNALFYFCEDVLLHLDNADKIVTANIPLYFSLQLSHFLGFKLNDNFNEEENILDLQEGCFTGIRPQHQYYIEGEYAQLTAQLLRVMQPVELSHFHLNHETRRKLLHCYHTYYALHIQDFSEMKTLTVLQDVL